MSQNDVTNESEVKETQPEAETASPAEMTVADLHEQEPTEDKPKKVDSVPFNKFIKEKERRKELERELEELRAQLSEDDDVDDVESTPEVKKLAQKLEQLEGETKKDKMEKKFYEHLSATLENFPEYKDVVNIDVIKKLAFDSSNANKTYKQLLDETYGKSLVGRRTIETTTPRGGAKDTKVDMERAKTDTSYRHEVLADPELRKQYNESLTDRIFK